MVLGITAEPKFLGGKQGVLFIANKLLIFTLRCVYSASSRPALYCLLDEMFRQTV